MPTITIKADTKEIESIMKSLNSWMQDFKKPLKDISKMQLKEIDEAFKVDWRNIIWKRWEKLKPVTTRQKIKLKLNKWILQRTWKLRKWFKQQKLNKDTLVIWNKIKYFKFHQTGTKKMAQRQVLGHGDIMIRRTKILLNKYLLTLIKKWMI